MRPIFDIDALRALVVGVELGSFARAAVQLGRSQSAVSMQLKKLEEQAGQGLLRRSGRGLVPTEAGDALLAYARRIVELHDEAAASLGIRAAAASIRVGLPQDFFEDIMPDAMARFALVRPDIHIEVRAGRNYALEEEVRSGQLDLALAFSRRGPDEENERLASLPMRWFGGKGLARPSEEDPVLLVLFDHPCLFRQSALQALEAQGRRWRLSITTPSLPGVWAALQFGRGITIRTRHRVPAEIRDVGRRFGLPTLPPIDLRIVRGTGLSPAAAELHDILRLVVRERVREAQSPGREPG